MDKDLEAALKWFETFGPGEGSKHGKLLAAALRERDELCNRLIQERDEAETRWHAHQKNVPCSGCEGGHDTFWKSITDSPQWKAWEDSSPQWGVDECRECGHISQAHFQAFLDFVLVAKTAALEAANSEIERLKAEQGYDRHAALQAALEQAQAELGKWKDRADGWAKNHHDELELRVKFEAELAEAKRYLY